MLFHPPIQEIPPLRLAIDHPDYLPAWSYGEIYDLCLVLEGGAMRGQFTAGVLDYLMDNGIVASHVVGVSAGALNGFNYKAGDRGRSAYLNIKYCSDWRYLSLRSFILTGNAFNVDFAYHQLPEVLEPFDFQAFDKSPIELYTVASDLELGEANYHKLTNSRLETDWLRASASMPLLSHIVNIDGKLLLDGGVCDSVPLRFAQTLGASRIIIVLTQDATYRKSPYNMMPLARRAFKDYPWFLERLETRHCEYNRIYREVSHMEKNADVLVFRPPVPVDIHHLEHDPNKLYNLYLTGYNAAQTRCQELREFLR